MSGDKSSPPQARKGKAAIVVAAAVVFIIGVIFIGMNTQHAREQSQEGKVMTPSKVN